MGKGDEEEDRPSRAAGEKETRSIAPDKPIQRKTGKIADYRVSIIGAETHMVGQKLLRRGTLYSFKDLGVGKDKIPELHEDPYVVMEPVNAAGELVRPESEA
jgi:hypothetical protein